MCLVSTFFGRLTELSEEWKTALCFLFALYIPESRGWRTWERKTKWTCLVYQVFSYIIIFFHILSYIIRYFHIYYLFDVKFYSFVRWVKHGDFIEPFDHWKMVAWDAPGNDAFPLLHPYRFVWSLDSSKCKSGSLRFFCCCFLQLQFNSEHHANRANLLFPCFCRSSWHHNSVAEDCWWIQTWWNSVSCQRFTREGCGSILALNREFLCADGGWPILVNTFKNGSVIT